MCLTPLPLGSFTIPVLVLLTDLLSTRSGTHRQTLTQGPFLLVTHCSFDISGTVEIGSGPWDMIMMRSGMIKFCDSMTTMIRFIRLSDNLGDDWQAAWIESMQQ